MSPLQNSPEKILVPRGFSFAALAAGIKVSGRPDLALAEVGGGATASALFTTNRVVAAPITVGRASLAKTRGRVRALIVNSGNANCATGRAGISSCEVVCRDAAKILGAPPSEVFPSSTGIIGVRFPAEKIQAKLPELIAARSSTIDAAEAFAHAIMTTDLRPKIAARRLIVSSKEVTILGVAKGAGMIHPQMATMLVYLFTDLAAPASELKKFLCHACDESFNCMSIDGDTSTNDTALLLASGTSGARLKDSASRKQFAAALNDVSQSLAEQIISDGEGVKHVIRLHIRQARSRDEALTIARTIAHSALVKTAWAGADPNWGRILAAIGRSGIPVNPARVQISIGNQKVCRNGAAASFDERKAHQALSEQVCDIDVDLGRGKHSVRFLTTDLTAEYVRINADYST
jgi:glutamate N-acetyltransferase / amino-acid N-acetyltransferase